MEAGGVGSAARAASAGVASATDVSVKAGVAFGSSGGMVGERLAGVGGGAARTLGSSR